MQRTKEWFGVLVVALPIAFVACGDGDDSEGSGGGKGGKGGSAGEAGEGAMGGTTTGGRGGSAGSTSGTSGASGRGGTGGASTGGEGGAGMGGFGGEEGGMGGEAGTTQGGTAGMSGSGGATAGMGGKGGAGAGGGGAGGGGAGAGGAGMGGAGMGGAGAGMGGAGAGMGGAGMGGAGMGGAGMGGAGMGGAGMGGAGMGGAGMAGMAGAGGAAPTCDPNPAPQFFVGEFSGAQEVPPVISSGTGFAVAELSPGETQLTVSFYWSGLTSNTTAAHIHGPAVVGVGGAGIIFPLTVPTPTALSGEVVGATFAINAGQVAQLKQSLYYANVHSVMNSGGELRAQLVPATLIRSGTLSAAQETTPVTSSATGRAVIAVFPGNTKAAVSASWTGLTTNTSNGHVHGPAAAGATASPVFPFFATLPPPGATTSGSLVHMIWNLGAGHFEMVRDNLTYTNIHSTMYTGGEIRAQMLPACTP